MHLGKSTRREFITLLGGTVASWGALKGAAETAAALPLIGFMSTRAEEDSGHLVTSFLRGLEESGFRQGRNIEIEYRWGRGQYDRLYPMAEDLVRRNVAVIVCTGGAAPATAAKAATSTIPIVFSVGPDPVQLGLVASFNRPGGNATGVSLLTTQLEAKRLGILHELAPGAEIIGVLLNPENPPSVSQESDISEGARSINRGIEVAHASKPNQLETAFASLVRYGVKALLVGADPFFDTQRERLVRFAAEQRLPALYQFREYVVAGGLASYGISVSDAYRQVGSYAATILKGAKPADLPVLQPTKFELVINLKTARALGLEVPAALLARADEVIE
ncbi:MAG: ABC transporter substrate-binding protein [Xanthobacteraceae bacterium]